MYPVNSLLNLFTYPVPLIIECCSVGDFNPPKVDLKNGTYPQTHEHTSVCVVHCSTTVYVSEPSRLNNILDLVFVNDPLIVNITSVECPIANSDHNTVVSVVSTLAAIGMTIISLQLFMTSVEPNGLQLGQNCLVLISQICLRITLALTTRGFVWKYFIGSN